VLVDESTYMSLPTDWQRLFSLTTMNVSKISREVRAFRLRVDDVPANEAEPQRHPGRPHAEPQFAKPVMEPGQSRTGKWVFVCYNSIDKALVSKINRILKEAGIETWFDEERIRPGKVWQDELELAIEQFGACLIFMGESGVGPWQGHEVRAILNEFVERGCIVIPVVLSHTSRIPEIPLFLKNLQLIDLRVDESLGLVRIIETLKRLG
jgi:hypothetical protein